MDVKTLASEFKQYGVEVRRRIHSQPELSWQEKETTALIIKELEALGIPYVRPAETGVIAIIQGTKAGEGKGKVVGLRADIDALPIQEANECSYKSTIPNVMHACGHDTHTASLLEAVQIIWRLRNQFHGTVKAIFQPSEEYFPSGALAMMSKGDLDDVNAFYGSHVSPEIPTGQISVEAGPRMASSASIDIKVTGKSGHGARPHTAIDALVAAAAIVMNLQTLVSRELPMENTAVISIGTIQSGTAKNIIAEEAVMSGTFRFFDPNLEGVVGDAVARIAQNTAAAYRAKASVTITPGLPPVINDENLSAITKKSLIKLWGDSAVGYIDRSTGVEDFAYYSKIAPSIMAYFGGADAKKETNYALHNSRFDVDEDCLTYAASLYAQFALDFLA